jgi:transcriptional regulator with XRE-family HTH domain
VDDNACLNANKRTDPIIPKNEDRKKESTALNSVFNRQLEHMTAEDFENEVEMLRVISEKMSADGFCESEEFIKMLRRVPYEEGEELLNSFKESDQYAAWFKEDRERAARLTKEYLKHLETVQENNIRGEICKWLYILEMKQKDLAELTIFSDSYFSRYMTGKTNSKAVKDAIIDTFYKILETKDEKWFRESEQRALIGEIKKWQHTSARKKAEELAKRTGYSVHTVNKYMNATEIFPEETLNKMLDALDIPNKVDFSFFGQSPPEHRRGRG